MTAFKKSGSIMLVLCLCIILFSFLTVDVFAADTVSVEIVSFTRGEQEDLRSSELLEARVTGYDGNVQELTYKWTNTLGTYLYVYNSHNMYGINNTDGEIEIYNSSVSSSANMSGRSYKDTFSGVGFAWAAVYGASISSSSLVGTVTVEVYDPEGNLLATDSHTGTREQTGGYWWWATYENHGFVESNLEEDISYVYFGLFEGDTKNVKILLGESSIVHITCAECSVSDPEIVYGEDIIKIVVDSETEEAHIKSISGTSNGEAKVQITLTKSNCKFHQNNTSTKTIEVYVYKKPTTTSTATAIMLDNLDDRCTYYIGGAKGERQTVDGKEYVVFEGLTPNTSYQIEVVGQANDEVSPVYAYVYETTKPAHIGTVEVILNGTYDTSTGTAEGERVDIETVLESCETLYLRYEDSEIYFPLEKADTGVYTSELSDGNYTIYYSLAGSDEKIQLGDQTLTISGASRTRELFFNSVSYDENGGVPAIDAEYYLVESNVTVTDVIPEKEGYLFTNWVDEDGNTYKTGDTLTQSIGKAYTLTAQYVESFDVYVNIVIRHISADGDFNNDDGRHDIIFTVDSRTSNVGDYAELVSKTIDWDGVSEYAGTDFSASYIEQNGQSRTTYVAAEPTLVNVAKDAQYTFTTTKSGYELVSVTSETDENGDLQLYAELIFDPNDFDFFFEVELDEASKKVADELKPAAVNVKVTSWYDTPHDEDYGQSDSDETVAWYTITQQRYTYERIALDEDGYGCGTFPVWIATTDTDTSYSYRIEVVSYETADGTIIPAIDKDGEHIVYQTELNRYSAEVTVSGGKDPDTTDDNTLTGAYYDGSAQVGTVKAVVTIEVFDVTFNPNGGVLNDSTENTVLNYQRGIPTLTNYIPTREGGYVFDGWYLADENGEMTDEVAVSDTIIFADTTLVAKWKEPLTVKGTLAIAGTYIITDELGMPMVMEIYEHDRASSATVLLQRIDANGYAETVATTTVSVTYEDGYGIGTYEFDEIEDNGHTYRVKVVSANYHTHYLNETSGADVTDYSAYKEDTEDDMYLAEFGGDTTAEVNIYLHFEPHDFILNYSIDASSVGEGFRPTAAEVLVLCDTGEHIDPQHWDVISQMIVGGEYVGNDEKLTDGEGEGEETVWQIKPDGVTPYDYSIRIDSLTFDESVDVSSLPYAIYYNGSARYSEITDEVYGQTQLLTATIVPRMYTVTFEIGDIPEGVTVSGMDSYVTVNNTLEDTYYWSYGKAVTATPAAEGYTFLGWCDEDGERVTSVSAASAGDVTLTANWIANVEFEVLADAGYYAENRGGSDKYGVIAFNAKISNFDAVKDRIASFGIYVYNPTGSEVKATAESSDITVLETNGGEFHVIISDIAEENFDTKLLAAPYVVVDGEIIMGETMTMSVSETGKWLGPKS